MKRKIWPFFFVFFVSYSITHGANTVPNTEKPNLKPQHDEELEALVNRCTCHHHPDQPKVAPICLRSTESDSANNGGENFDCQGIVDISSCQQAFTHVHSEGMRKDSMVGSLRARVVRPPSIDLSRDKFVLIGKYQDFQNLLCYNSS